MYSVIAEPALEKSDMYKALTDFISYANINLTWFALNFVICIMPCLCIYGLGQFGPIREHATGSYTPIMYVLWATHCVSFASQLRIYDVTAQKKDEVKGQSQVNLKDDDFQANAQDKLLSVKVDDDNFAKAKDEAKLVVPNPTAAKQAKELSDYSKEELASMTDKKRAELEKKAEMKKLEQILPSFWCNTVSFEAHYERWQRFIEVSHKWLWILNGLITIGCIVAYTMTDGKELVLMYYIPLDFAFNMSRSAFFWYNVFLDKKKMQNDLKLQKRAQ